MAKGEVHIHLCCDCGHKWWCLNDCLAKCGCIGKPHCMHWPCVRCADYSLVRHHVQPAVGRSRP